MCLRVVGGDLLRNADACWVDKLRAGCLNYRHLFIGERRDVRAAWWRRPTHTNHPSSSPPQTEAAAAAGWDAGGWSRDGNASVHRDESQ